MFSYIDLERRVPAEHPLRAMGAIAGRALGEMSEHFDTLYARRGRPSIPPEQLIGALLLQVLYGIRSERQLMERIRYDLLFRWFVGLEMDEAEWDATVFTKNRDRLMAGEVTQRLLAAVLEQARSRQLLSEEHFTVDGMLLEAWASRDSFEPKEPGGVVGTGTRGRQCLRDTHESKSDPQARLYKKSAAGEVKASYLGQVIIENRHGLVVAACATQSGTAAEREAAVAMLETMDLRADARAAPVRATLGADKHYQERRFIEELRRRRVAPHVAQYAHCAQWPNHLSEAERNDPGYRVSQRKRKLVEKVFGWGKLNSVMRKIKLRGMRRVDWFFRLLTAAYNVVRMAKLIPAR